MKKHIQRWLQKGLISEELASTLFTDYIQEQKRVRKRNFQVLLYSLGAILIGLGVLSFVASNIWQLLLLFDAPISRVIGMTLLTTITFYFGNKFLYVKKRVLFGNALILMATIFIGGTYAVIGQAYNSEANSSGLFLLWFISVAPVAYLLKLPTVNKLSMLLLTAWFILFNIENTNSNYTLFFIPAIIGAFFYTLSKAPFIKNKYTAFVNDYEIFGIQTIFLSLLVMVVAYHEVKSDLSIYYLIGTLILLIANIYVLSTLKGNITNKLEQIFTVAFLLFMVLLLAVNINEYLIGIVTHALTISLIAISYKEGYVQENAKALIVAGNWLIAYIAITYFRFSWSFLDKTTFFIIGGVILITIARLLERQRKKIKKNNSDSE